MFVCCHFCLSAGGSGCHFFIKTSAPGHTSEAETDGAVKYDPSALVVRGGAVSGKPRGGGGSSLARLEKLAGHTTLRGAYENDVLGPQEEYVLNNEELCGITRAYVCT